VAFSIGFVFGPLIGAIFSRWAREQQGEFYVYPALFALVLSVIDVIYIAVLFKETLPQTKRVGSQIKLFCCCFFLFYNVCVKCVICSFKKKLLKSTIICVEKTAVENIHTMSISGHLR
jgi:MFS family permease